MTSLQSHTDTRPSLYIPFYSLRGRILQDRRLQRTLRALSGQHPALQAWRPLVSVSGRVFPLPHRLLVLTLHW